MNKAIFLDRDGVIIDDVDLLTTTDQVVISNRVIIAFEKLKNLGYKLFVVTNQTVIARGLCSEEDVKKVHNYISKVVQEHTGVTIDAFYYCPHHPHATIEEYRTECDCRKPGSEMLFRAAEEYYIDLKKSWMIGDRISDINAGLKAGCRTIQVETGAHEDKPILSEKYDVNPFPDYVCRDLLNAVELIMENQ